MSPIDSPAAFAESDVPSAASTVVRGKGVYVTSGAALQGWGQPDASYYVFWVQGRLLRGEPYVGSPSGLMTAELASELADWESLSDEAWTNLDSQMNG